LNLIKNIYNTSLYVFLILLDIEKEIMMEYEHYYNMFRELVGRPKSSSFVQLNQSVTFQILDVVVSDTLARPDAQCARNVLTTKANEIPVSPEGNGNTIVTMFGVTQCGRSVCCHVFGFHPVCHLLCHSMDAMKAAERWLEKYNGKYWIGKEYKYNFAGFQWDESAQDRKKNLFIRITCADVSSFYNLLHLPHNLSKYHQVELIEHTGIPLYTKFYDQTQLMPFQWISVEAQNSVPSGYVSSCDIEFYTNMNAWRIETELRAPAPYLFASCDIEVFSESGEFPMKTKDSDKCFMVGMTLQRFGGTLQRNRDGTSMENSATMLHTCFVYDDTLKRDECPYKKIQGRDGTIHILRYPTERAMLEGWRDCVCIWLDADIVLWYNGFRFDLDYMAYRVIGRTPSKESCCVDARYGDKVGSRFFQFSKFVRASTPLIHQDEKSFKPDMSLYSNEYGRITMDLYDLISSREKRSSYKLDSVCQDVLKVIGGTINWKRGTDRVYGSANANFNRLIPGDSLQLAEEFYTIGSIVSDTELILKDVPIDIDADVSNFPLTGRVTKIELSPHEMFKQYRNRNFDDIADYCTRDCVAPLLLLWKMRYFVNDFQMCCITFTPIQQLWSRGQGIRGLNQVIRFAHQKGFLLNSFRGLQQVDYKGATVVDPEKGFHTSPVVTLDFMSLYPSIIISRWMCWSTVALDDTMKNIPNILYHKVVVSEAQMQKVPFGYSDGKNNYPLPGVSQQLFKTLLETLFRPALAESANKMDITKELKDLIDCNPMVPNNVTESMLLYIEFEKEELAYKFAYAKKVLRDDGQVEEIPLDAVCPELLKALLQARKITKREMFSTTDSEMKELLNAKQLAQKLSCNSVYGLTGSKTGVLKCVPIACSTTAYGRQILEQTKELAVNFLGKDKVSIIYGDTDSIMVKFHTLPGTREGIEKAWVMGESAGDWITKQLDNGIILECEKVYCPYLLVMKKCYAAIKYEGEGGKLPEHPCRDVKGLELAKRDTSKFMRQVQSRVINQLLMTADETQALQLIALMIQDVCMLRVPMSDFVTSKSIKKEYKVDPVQKKVNDMRRHRAPGSEYKPGERVPMIAIESRGKGTPKLSHRTGVSNIMDDPEYAQQQGWLINREYYLNEMQNKSSRVLFTQQVKLDELFKVAEQYLNSRMYNLLVPFNMEEKMNRIIVKSSVVVNQPAKKEKTKVKPKSTFRATPLFGKIKPTIHK